MAWTAGRLFHEALWLRRVARLGAFAPLRASAAGAAVATSAPAGCVAAECLGAFAGRKLAITRGLSGGLGAEREPGPASTSSRLNEEGSGGTNGGPHSAVAAEREGKQQNHPTAEDLDRSLETLKKLRQPPSFNKEGDGFVASLLRSAFRLFTSVFSTHLLSRIDKDFEKEEFLEGAVDAFYIVNSLLGDGDFKTLEPMLSAGLMKQFQRVPHPLDLDSPLISYLLLIAPLNRFVLSLFALFPASYVFCPTFCPAPCPSYPPHLTLNPPFLFSRLSAGFYPLARPVTTSQPPSCLSSQPHQYLHLPEPPSCHKLPQPINLIVPAIRHTRT